MKAIFTSIFRSPRRWIDELVRWSSEIDEANRKAESEKLETVRKNRRELEILYEMDRQEIIDEAALRRSKEKSNGLHERPGANT